MTWKCYLAIFKAESPVHIGYRQIGILKTTRYYITGRAMWGAITANLTRALFSNPDPKDYQAVGNFVRENIRTTYFYPAIKKNDVKDPENWSEYEVDNYLVFLHEYTDSGIKFGEKWKEEFEQTFVGSFVSTALESQTKTAEEGSLHEFEFIRNKVSIENKSHNVYWVGYVFVNVDAQEILDSTGKKLADVVHDDMNVSFTSSERKVLLSNVLDTLLVGGEKNYGFGRLTLEPEGFKLKSQKLFGKFKFEVDNEKPVITGDIAPAHVKLEENELKGFLGEIEPVVGLEWSEKGAGQRVSGVFVCISPGSCFVEQNHHGITRKIDYILHKYGLLIIKIK